MDEHETVQGRTTDPARPPLSPSTPAGGRADAAAPLASVPSPPAGPASGDPNAHLVGVGGWLLFFILGLVASALLMGWDLVTVFRLMGRGMSPAVGSDAALVVGIAFIWLLGVGVGLALIAKRWVRTPAYWIVFQVLSIGLLSVYAVASQRVVEAVNHLPYNPNNPDTQNAVDRAVVLSLIWIVYWCRSKRVLHTFGTRGFGRRRQRATDR